jgi:hypothetical protein
MFWAYAIYMLVKMATRVRAADARTLINASMPLCEFHPKDPT